MASSNSGGPGSVTAGDIFNVNGMVAVVTGGGSGSSEQTPYFPQGQD